MFQKIMGVWVFIGLVLFFSFLISDLAYGVGIIAWFISIIFSLLTYLGASCDLAVKLGLMINSILLLFVIVKIYWYFKDT